MLQYFITSKTKREVLRLFLTNPTREFYVREIVRLTGEPLNAVRRELAYLGKAGLLLSRRSGNRRYFRVDQSFPFYSELKKIVYSTIGLGEYLRDGLEDAKAIKLAFVYGSVAKGGETERSDIDLFVVGDVPEMELHARLSELEKRIGREINYTLMTEKEFAQRIRQDDPFLRRILREDTLLLKGSLDVYRETRR